MITKPRYLVTSFQIDQVIGKRFAIEGEETRDQNLVSSFAMVFDGTMPHPPILTQTFTVWGKMFHTGS